MRADQAKTIPIDRYLEHLGHKPAKIRSGGRELFYHSPIREGDSTPSFKVDTSINKWYDHGLSRGGNTLDLAVELCRGSVRDALHALERTNLYNRYGYTARSDGFTKVGTLLENRRFADEKEKVGANAFRLVREGPIEHPALLQYLEKRKIDLTVARKYLKEIRFEPASGGKWFFALGWPNGTGYEARNSLFKGFVGAGKDISYLKTPNSSEIAVFEGFMDFLSYLTENKLQKLPFSAIILNSGNMKARALPCIAEGGYSKVNLFMDNDDMGDECLKFFETSLETLELIDHRSEYEGFKDFNARVVAE
jgi:hypothetical protein